MNDFVQMLSHFLHIWLAIFESHLTCGKLKNITNSMTLMVTFITKLIFCFLFCRKVALDV